MTEDEKLDILDDLVERWHFGEEGPDELREFLAMTPEQYDQWGFDGEVPDDWTPPDWAGVKWE